MGTRPVLAGRRAPAPQQRGTCAVEDTWGPLPQARRLHWIPHSEGCPPPPTRLQLLAPRRDLSRSWGVSPPPTSCFQLCGGRGGQVEWSGVGTNAGSRVAQGWQGVSGKCGTADRLEVLRPTPGQQDHTQEGNLSADGNRKASKEIRANGRSSPPTPSARATRLRAPFGTAQDRRTDEGHRCSQRADFSRGKARSRKHRVARPLGMCKGRGARRRLPPGQVPESSVEPEHGAASGVRNGSSGVSLENVLDLRSKKGSQGAGPLNPRLLAQV